MATSNTPNGKGKSGSFSSQGENTKSSSRQAHPLHEAIKRGLLADVERALSTNPSSVNDLDQFGQTPLHIAAFEGQVPISNVLISKGASISTQDKNGWTPLHSAASGGNLAICEKLLHQGADPNAQVRKHFCVKADCHAP